MKRVWADAGCWGTSAWHRTRIAGAMLAPGADLGPGRPQGRLETRNGRGDGAMMPEAYIVDAVRSPVGKRNGGLSKIHPADLGAHSLNALMSRTGIDPSAVEDVIFGCVDTLGPQAGDIARTAWLAAGLPEEVPGTTIDRQCGSSQQAVHFAGRAVMSGTSDVIVAGGVQCMSMIGIPSTAMTMAAPLGFSDPFSGSEEYGASAAAMRRFRSSSRPR